MEPLAPIPSQCQSTGPASPRLPLGPRWLLELQPSLGLQKGGRGVCLGLSHFL